MIGRLRAVAVNGSTLLMLFLPSGLVLAQIAREETIDANEFAANVVVLVEPVGVDQPQRPLGRLPLDLAQELVAGVEHVWHLRSLTLPARLMSG